MIRNFSSRTAQDIYDASNTRHSRKVPSTLHSKARRLLDQLHVARSIEVLRVPPGNRLEKLSGQREGFWSVRVNSQWRIIFRWDEGEVLDVDIVDYH